MEIDVSIIIPTYKRSEMIGRAINSVLHQTYKNIEVIVVDDNDEDSEYRKITEEKVKQYLNLPNFTYLKHNKNKNGAVARNTGIKKAKGKYIGFLDDDDEFLKEKIEMQVNALKNTDDKIGAVYCGYNVLRGNKIISQITLNDKGDLFEKLLLMNWGTGSGSNVLFKRSVFESIGLFDEELTRHQDWDILLRMFYKFEIIDIPQIGLNIYKDSRINIPNADKFVEIEKYFIGKFYDRIKTLPEYIENEILQKHCLELCTAYLKNKNYKEAKKYYKIADKYKKIDNKNKVIMMLVVIFVNLPFKEFLLVWCGKIIDKFRIVKF